MTKNGDLVSGYRLYIAIVYLRYARRLPPTSARSRSRSSFQRARSAPVGLARTSAWCPSPPQAVSVTVLPSNRVPRVLLRPPPLPLTPLRLPPRPGTPPRSPQPPGTRLSLPVLLLTLLWSPLPPLQATRRLPPLERSIITTEPRQPRRLVQLLPVPPPLLLLQQLLLVHGYVLSSCRDALMC